MGWLAALLLLAGCAPALTPTAVAPTLPAGPYDGRWSGSGRTEQGLLVNLAFDVQDSALSAISYDFTGGAGLLCTNLSYNHLPLASRPQISGKQVTAQLGIDLQLSAQFVVLAL